MSRSLIADVLLRSLTRKALPTRQGVAADFIFRPVRKVGHSTRFAPIIKLPLDGREEDPVSVLSSITKMMFGQLKKKPIAGITPPNFKQSVLQLVEDNLFKKGSLLVEKKEPEQCKENPLAGKVVVIEQGLVEMRKSKTKKPQVIFVPGLGGGTSSSRVERNLSSAQKFLPNADMVVYVPLHECDAKQHERYANGTKLYDDRNFINEEESRNFFEQVIKTKFCDEQGNLLPPEQCERLILVNHSIGAREAVSHMKWLKRHLAESGLGEAEIKKYMDKILRINIASPDSFHDESDLSRSITFFNTNDCGSKKPWSFLVKICMNPVCYEQAVNLFSCDDKKRHVICTMAPGIIPSLVIRDNEVVAIDVFSHGIDSYEQGMNTNAEVKAILDACAEFLNPSLSDHKAHDQIDMVLAKANPLPEKMSPEMVTQGMECLTEAWRDHHLLQAMVDSGALSSLDSTVQTISAKKLQNSPTQDKSK
jgi:hypothetical protein